MDTLCLKPGFHTIAPSIAVSGSIASQVIFREKSSTPPVKKMGSYTSSFSFRFPLQSLWGGGKSLRQNGIALDDAVLVESNAETRRSKGVFVAEEGKENRTAEGQNENWILKIMQVRSLWNGSEELKTEEEDVVPESSAKEDEDVEGCDFCRVENGHDNEMEFDRDSFSKLLKRVSLAEAKLYAQMSYLGSLAYCIPKIKPENLLRFRGLRFVTSSLEKRNMAMKAEKEAASVENQEVEKEISETEEATKKQKNNVNRVSAFIAFEIAASAASYLHSHTKSILPFKSSKPEIGKDSSEGTSESNRSISIMNSEMASLMATTDSVTAVVAAKEEVKQAVADDLSSTRSSPCEWFICDDDQGTRFFVIQGSETLASWQANLLFEPVEFEGLDVLVHRGIYEAAKGMYEQMLPEVRAHLKSHGNRASFRFTGHSLGGSLSLLLNLMLLVRGEVPVSSLLPVIMFGAPSVMCGGDHLLRNLGLPRSHVQAITMHRDIVPRAFSCNYPNHVAELLKAINGNFRNHPCLNNQKLLYAPMGELLILQPEEKFSPHHHLLPSGSGLYFLSCPLSDTNDAEKVFRAAQTLFLNSPHPLEILSDRSAYGSEGTIQRDHDMSSYLKSVRNVIRHELNRIRKTRRRNRRRSWWPLLSSGGRGVIVGTPLASINMGQNQFNFSGMLQSGRDSLKRFSRLVASQHMHLLVVFLLPARVLLLGAYNVINVR